MGALFSVFPNFQIVYHSRGPLYYVPSTVHVAWHNQKKDPFPFPAFLLMLQSASFCLMDAAYPTNQPTFLADWTWINPPTHPKKIQEEGSRIDDLGENELSERTAYRNPPMPPKKTGSE